MDEHPAARQQRDRSDTKPGRVADAMSTLVGKLRADDDMFELLDAFASLDPDAIEKVDVPRARANPTIADAVRVMLTRQGRSTDPQDLVPGVEDRALHVAGAAGELPATVYLPASARNGERPVVLYFHGGGWVIADRHVYDGGARGLAHAADAVVVSVDYRQAPEHRFPAAWDDALAAYRSVLANAAALGGRTDCGVALAGESAGGNLALATAIAARDAGLPLPAHVLAVYPVTQTSLNTESYLENAIAKPLNRAMIEWFVDKLVRSPDDLQDRRLQLIDADLRGLCPVTLISARIDPLRSDSAKMADALERAGVPVAHRDYEGVTHEFFGCAAVVRKAQEAQTYAGERLREAFLGAR